MEKELPIRKSIWQRQEKQYGYPEFTGEKTAETLVIGGGLCGAVICAELVKRGHRPVLVTEGHMFGGNTSRTTARITVQHDLIYNRLIKKYGMDTARLYYRANLNGLNKIKEDISALNIKNTGTVNAVLYTNSVFKKCALNKEIKAYKSLDIPYGTDIDFELNTQYLRAVSLPDQLVINPVIYLDAVLNSIKDSVEIYEHSRVIDIKDSTAILYKGRIRAENIIIATNFPFINRTGFYLFKEYRHRSYCTTFEGRIRDMYESVDNDGLEIRPYSEDGTDYIITGGLEHRTGKGRKNYSYYGNLEKYSRETVSVGKTVAGWSAQDAMSMDLLPLAGRYSDKAPNLFFMSGMNKWGFTMSRTGAEVICDVMENKSNPYYEIYNPERSTALKSVIEFLPQAVIDAGSLLTTLFQIPEKLSSGVKNGEGAVISHKGKRIGIYKDNEGRVYTVNGTCPHFKCALKWNKEELSFDCPCHGSRFDIRGEMLDGPAVGNLNHNCGDGNGDI